MASQTSKKRGTWTPLNSLYSLLSCNTRANKWFSEMWVYIWFFLLSPKCHILTETIKPIECKWNNLFTIKRIYLDALINVIYKIKIIHNLKQLATRCQQESGLCFTVKVIKNGSWLNYHYLPIHNLTRISIWSVNMDNANKVHNLCLTILKTQSISPNSIIDSSK